MSVDSHAARRAPRAAAAAVLIAAAAAALLWIGRASAGDRPTVDARLPAGTARAASTFSFSSVPITKADGAVHDLTASFTCAPTYHPMDDMTKTFKLGGRAAQRVVVLLAGEFFDAGDPNAAAFVRLTIDGAVQSPQETVIATYKSGAEETAGFNWITEPLAPGNHTATILWRDGGAAPMFAGDTSVIVLHK